MTPEEFLRILNQAAKLKTTTRHCFTEGTRAESVADHSWRISLMAMLLTGIQEFEGVNLDKVIRMCLIHDLGESFTGDIPSFEKTEADSACEEDLFLKWVNTFPSPQREEWLSLLAEMSALETREAKTYKALDKLEAVISHDESDIATWLPLEYDLQLVYTKKNVAFSDYLKALDACVDERTREKIEEGK